MCYTGLGCKRSDVDKWVAHQDDFNSLLANLNQSSGDPAGDNEGPTSTSSTSGVQSLEAKSKSSRSRVQ